MGWQDAPIVGQQNKPMATGWQSAPLVNPPQEVTPQAPQQAEEQGFLGKLGERMMTSVEPALAIGSSVVAEPIAGLAGIAQAVNPFAEPGAGAEAVEKTREALTYKPRKEEAREALKTVGETIAQVVEPVSKAVDAAADYAYDVTGSPAVAAAVKTTPVAIAEIVGLKGLRSMRTGTRLIDDLGRPTPQLRKALDKQGLVYENLTPEAKKLIPDVAPPKTIPSPKAEVQSVGEKALVQQIKSGARDDALATLKVVNDRIQVDKLGQEAIKQGFDPGFVQAVKTANPQTKKSMAEMLTRMERITKNRRLALDMRPSDVAGNAALSRFKFIRNKADEARKQLNVIAKTKLKGKPVNPQPVVDQLAKSLDDLNVRLEGSGVPTPVFAGSQIAKDRTSQRIIKDLVDLMAEGGEPDALRFHNLKRQLDRMIDFRKKSAGGLTDAGKGVLKDIRRSLNDSLRAADDSYANVNDTLSQSLTALDEFKEAVGPSVAKLDFFSEGASKAVGTKLRTLMGNQQKRIELDNALTSLDEVANNLGGTFKTDYKDLALFANRIEDRFGSAAEASFKGDIESAVQRASTMGPKATVTEAVAGKVAEKAEKLRGVNDFNAFNSMRDLLNGK